VAFGDAITKEAALPERAHPAFTQRINVVVSSAAALDLSRRLPRPLIQLVGEGAMLGIEKRQP
jgi:hypothetical protein